MESRIKECFVCDFCRNICGGSCSADLERLESGVVDDKNRDLVGGRKKRVTCLGPYCDKPCCFQKEEFTPYKEEDGLSAVFDVMKFLLNIVNESLVKQ